MKIHFLKGFSNQFAIQDTSRVHWNKTDEVWILAPWELKKGQEKHSRRKQTTLSWDTEESTGTISEFWQDSAAQWLSTNDVLPAFYSLQGTNLGERRGLMVFGVYLSSVGEAENFD